MLEQVGISGAGTDYSTWSRWEELVHVGGIIWCRWDNLMQVQVGVPGADTVSRICCWLDKVGINGAARGGIT